MDSVTMASVRRSYQRAEQSDLGVEDGGQPPHPLHPQPPGPHPPDHTIMIQDTRAPLFLHRYSRTVATASFRVEYSAAI